MKMLCSFVVHRPFEVDAIGVVVLVLVVLLLVVEVLDVGVGRVSLVLLMGGSTVWSSSSEETVDVHGMGGEELDC